MNGNINYFLNQIIKNLYIINVVVENNNKRGI